MVEEYTFHNPDPYRKFCAVADKIARDPALLEIPLANIARWLAAGNHDCIHRLGQWRELIEAAQRSPEGMAALLALLRDDSEDARFFKGFSPMAGILTKAERRALTTCVYAH